MTSIPLFRDLRTLACLLPALALLGQTAIAQDAPVTDGTLCPLTDDNSSCTRVLACIGDEGRWFHGRSFGRGSGWLTGTTDDGVTCTGNWVSQNTFGLGQADVTCSDGMAVTVYYFYQDPYTGTATGRGLSNRGDLVQSWSGTHVLSNFAQGRPTAQARLRCGAHDIPLS